MMNNVIQYTKLEEKMVLSSTIMNVPISGAFELLPTCNLKCKMCYLKGSAELCKREGKLQSVEEWLHIAKQMLDNGTLFLLLTGGEPFLFPDFFELFLKLRAMGFIITINTNGTLIGKREAEFLADNMPRRVNITLYGTCRETYKRVTGSAEAFDRAIQGIQLLLTEGVPVKLNVSLIPENVDELEQFYRIANGFGVPIEINTYMYPATREESEVYNGEVRLSPHRAAQAHLLDKKLSLSKSSYNHYLNEMKKLYEELNSETEQETYVASEHLPCRAARSSFWINWRCEMNACVFLNQKPINLFIRTFKEAWDEQVIEREKMLLPGKCTQCKRRKFCLICGAAALHESNRMDSVPKYLCEMTQELLKLAYEELTI